MTCAIRTTSGLLLKALFNYIVMTVLFEMKNSNEDNRSDTNSTASIIAFYFERPRCIVLDAINSISPLGHWLSFQYSTFIKKGIIVTTP
jgi:hypothetical protein